MAVPAHRALAPFLSGQRLSRRLALPTLGALTLALAACGPSGGAGGPPGGQMPPPQVGVITLQPAEVTLRAELPGRLEARRVAQVRARVTGVVHQRLFTEGSVVNAGQSLFQIDDATYKASLDSGLASQARAEAALVQAAATLERNRPLAEAKAISQQEWVATQAAHKQAQADVAAAQAAVRQARLNLDYTAVRSPITGRIGRAQVTEGALVSQTEATLLATVQQVDALYVNITQSATEALRLKRAVQAGQWQAPGVARAQLLLEDGSLYRHPARLLFTDLSVDPTSGQVSLRAEVPNPEGDLLPGLYVRVRLDQARSDSGLLVPQQAVTRGTTGDTVMRVAEGNVVQVQPVQLGNAQGNQWVVLGGLKAGDRIIVDGFQKIQPKAPVTPVPWAPAGAASSAAAPTPASAASR